MRLISELTWLTDSTSNKQYTKQTEADALVAWQDYLSAGVGKTKTHATSGFEFIGAAHVFQSGCDFQITSPRGDRPAAKDVIKMVNSITKKSPRGTKEIALLIHYRYVVLD